VSVRVRSSPASPMPLPAEKPKALSQSIQTMLNHDALKWPPQDKPRMSPPHLGQGARHRGSLSQRMNKAPMGSGLASSPKAKQHDDCGNSNQGSSSRRLSMSARTSFASSGWGFEEMSSSLMAVSFVSGRRPNSFASLPRTTKASSVEAVTPLGCSYEPYPLRRALAPRSAGTRLPGTAIDHPTLDSSFNE